MATEAEIKTMLRYAVDVTSTERANGATVATKIATLEAAVTGGDVPDLETAIAGLRSANVGVLGRSPSVLAPILASYARVLSTNAPKTDPASALKAIFDRWMTSGDRITSRCWSRGAPSAGGSNVGNGNLRRLTLDERGQNIETGVAEVKTFTCTADQNLGVEKSEEVFTCQGATKPSDDLTVAGSGLATPIKAVSARNSLLQNASFSTYSGTTSAPTEISGWTPGSSINNFDIDTTNYYRAYPGDTTPASVIFQANDTLSQAFSLRRTQLDPAVPYYLQVAYNRQVGGTDGTLRIYLGTQSTTVALAAQTGWNLLYIPLTSACWYRNFGSDAGSILLELTGASTFGLRVDDVIFIPFTKIDTVWWALVGGSTAFSAKSGGDTFSVTDTTAADTSAEIQNELWRAYAAYLPSTYPTPTTTCTAALAGLGAGNVNNGDHYYKVAFVDGTGAGISGASADSNTVTTSAGNGQVALSAIPLGPNGTVARNLYRTAAGGGDAKFLATIADNTTTTYADNIADASLGASSNLLTPVTVAEP